MLLGESSWKPGHLWLEGQEEEMNDLGLAVGGAAWTEWGDPVTLLSPSALRLRPPQG